MDFPGSSSPRRPRQRLPGPAAAGQAWPPLIHVKGLPFSVATLGNDSHPTVPLRPHDASGRPRRTERETGMNDCTRRPFVLTAAMLLVMLVAGSPPIGAQTLKTVKERGTLNCGVG